MKQTIKQFTLFVISMFATLGLYAQVTTSTMSGRITEPDGSPLPGATVQATYVPTGARYYAVADNNGNYRILNMRPGGPYVVQVQMLGYQAVETKDISVALADNYILNVSLREEAIGLDAIVISAESITSNMRSDRAGAMTTVNLKTMENVPTIRRSMNDVIKLTPQVYVSGSGPQIGGGSYRSSFVTVDGAAFNNAFGIGQNLPAQGSPISLDAIEQMSISITPYDVRQSGFLGAAINAVTRSGSNEIEASVYTYYNNDSFIGKKVGNTTLTLSESKNHTYGFRVGAPIIKNKLFLFLNAEKEDVTAPGPSRLAATPAAPFTDGSNNIARPKASVLDAISDYLNTNHGYDPGAYQGYSSQSPGFKFLARLDWLINDNHKFNIRYSNTKKKSPNAPSTSTSGLGVNNFASTNRTHVNSMYFQNARYYQETNFSSVAGELNSRMLDGKLNNTLRVSYSHQYEPRSTEGGEFPFVDIVVDGKIYTSFGTELFSYGNLRDVKTWNVTDELSFSIGKHNILAGAQFETNYTQNGFQRFGAGYFTYMFSDEAALNTALSNKTLFNNPYQFAITHSMRDDFAQAFPSFTFNQLSLYLQDEYSFSNNFKVLAGVRLEFPMFPELNVFSEQVANTVLEERNGNGGIYNTNQLPSTKVMFSPRVGFNWDLKGDRSLVLRGGSGLYTGRIPFVWIVAQAGDAGVLQKTYTAVSGGSAVVPTFNADRLNLLGQIYPNGITGSAANITSVTLMDRNLRMPQTWKSSLALDVKLPWNIFGSIEGVYNRDVNPVTIRNIGLKDPVSSRIPFYYDNRMYYGVNYNSTLRNAYLLHNADVYGNYYSITAKLEQNNIRGISWMLAYSYSNAKSLTDGWGDQVFSAYQSAATVNGMNGQELGYAGYVMPHRVIGTMSYKINYLKHFATSFGLFYEGGPQGRASYTFTTNIVGDGSAANLIYVPEREDELTFSAYNYTNAAGQSVSYTAEQQRADFWNFISNDPYLNSRKGKYAERNGAIYPWEHKFDIKINQDFMIDVKGKKNTLQVGLDILNVGNLLNKNWGYSYGVNTSNLLLLSSNPFRQNSSAQPVYRFQRNGTEVLTKPFRENIGTSSTYYMQLSIRYIFN